MSFKGFRTGKSIKSEAEEPSEELSLLKDSLSNPGRRRSYESAEDGEIEEGGHSSFLPTTTSTHRRHQFKFKRPAKKSPTILILTCLIILSVTLIISLYLGLIPSFEAEHPSHQINWNRPPPRNRQWSNYYGLLRPKIGSKEWKMLYPPSKPAGPRPLESWIKRYDYLRSISSSNQLDSPLSTTWTNPQAKLSMQTGLAEYPEGTIFNSDPNGICSYRRASCLRGETEDRGIGLQDIWLGKNHTWSINFDDGPLPPSTSLYKFLDQQDETATHFWVGSNVRDYPELALQAWKRGDHLAVHTWSHAHLTTLSDFEILGELGWTIQIIHDLTGLVPLYYRPPYGDVDNRVRALAKHVFGLTTTLWNCDSSDWSLNQTFALGDFLDPPMNGFGVQESVGMINGHINQPDKSVGKIILEHELSFESVEAFKLTFPNLKQNSWSTCNLADCLDLPWYQ
ncbi:hypothetical protein PGT21_008094 [Puccinia graminis f. sp. tritici]|uniref:Chitin deacetylase 3 n=1 Tax=Puccinia graminis f. sp. tritici TaxID=56615 RepID=A0A5B0QI74_PUCGR|nr:hypothetical protein PGT21_008094 [Puccinia graminis f. sp. tritici]